MSYPFVSIVLPVRNEERYIDACLLGLLNQTYPSDAFEILVSDGRSTDGTRAKVEHFSERHPTPHIRLIDNPLQTVSPALNAAIRAARGSIIVRMDGHTTPAEDYVERCVEALERTGAGNVGGRIRPVGSTKFGEAVALAQTHVLGAGDAKFHFSQRAQDVDTVYLGAFDKTVFEHAGLFDETMTRNQDYEMNVRIRKAGFRIHLDPTISSTYTPRGDPRALWSQHFQYGWWRVVTSKRHPDSIRWRQLVPALFVAWLLVGLLATLFTSSGATALGLALVPYAAVLVAASARIAMRYRDPPLAARFALAISIIHVSWGLGYLTSFVTGSRFPYSHPGPPAIPRLTQP